MLLFKTLVTLSDGVRGGSGRGQTRSLTRMPPAMDAARTSPRPASKRKLLFLTEENGDEKKEKVGNSTSSTSKSPPIITKAQKSSSAQPKASCSRALANPSTSGQACSITAKPHKNTQKLSPSKFLPMLFDEEEGSSECDDDDDDWERDSASGGVGSPDGSEDEMETTIAPDNSEANDNIEQGGDTSQQDTAHSFVWSDGSDFVPHRHPFSSTFSGVTDEWPCDDNARECDYFRAFFNDATIDLIVTETNKYYQYVTNMFPFKDHSRVHKWIDTTPQELYVFLALM